VPLESGQNLLHYRLVEKIGEGGMGLVWKAVDTTLDREVAVKILPDAFASDPDRVSRFEREAKLLASLNHPNIATIHGFHQVSGVMFLAMELVEGQDLAQKLSSGPLPLEQALGFALQIADALQNAHDNGVVHRDLKPANVRLTVDGKVKVLDLGLAKAFEPDLQGGPAHSLSLSPTMTSAGTVAGVLLGTAAYMSPEQARGQAADRRSDVWAFGCVLFEMLGGRQTFEGGTASDTLASVLMSEPNWKTLPSDTPPPIRRVLRRCLNKDADQRLHHIADARLDIREALEGGEEVEARHSAATPAPSTPVWLRLLPWALFLLAAVVAIRGAATTAPAAPAETLNLSVPIPAGVRLHDDQFGTIAVSQDGKSLVFVGIRDNERFLYLRKLDQADAIELAGTEDATTPFFSPNGEWIAFFAENKLKKVNVQGGRPVTLTDSVGANRGATWGGDDVIVMSAHYTEPLKKIPGAGGDPVPLTTLDTERKERTHRWPEFIPGTDVVLFTAQTMDSPEFYDDARIDAVHVGTGERRTVFENASLARYVTSGHLVFAREGFLFAVAFDVEKLEATSAPVPVIENVMGSRNSGVVHAGYASNGLLAYIEGQSQARRRVLNRRSFDGGVEPIPVPVDGYLQPALSPDGQQLAVAIASETHFDIWTYDMTRETVTRLTFEGDNSLPVWSPDGKRIAFLSMRDGAAATFVTDSDGSGQAELLLPADWRPDVGAVAPQSWTADGRYMTITSSDRNGPNIVVLPLGEETEPIPFLETPFAEIQSNFSPDGKWIAYGSDESGTVEVYVRPFPGPGGRWQISIDGGHEPKWTADGRRIFFRSGRQLLAVEVDTREGFRVSRPRVLLDGLHPYSGTDQVYTLAPDGESAIFVEPVDSGSSPERITVVVNWLDELSRRLSR